MAVVLVWLLVFNKTSGSKQGASNLTPTPAERKTAAISGNVVFQGYASSEAYLVIVERSAGKSDFKSVVTGLVPATGNIPWTWKDATSGTNYDVQAQLKVRGITVQESAIMTISAPASNVVLGIVSNQQPPVQPQPQQTQVNGNVNINGYIPAGATVTFIADTSSGPGGQTTIPAIPAVDDSAWSWNTAVVGTTYDLIAQLVNSSGVAISPAVSKTITAPSSGLTFDLNSTAQPPAPTVVGLSGTININGSIPSNAYITLATRPAGSATFNQVVNNISATNGVGWAWAAAQESSAYDIQAYLWSNGQPYAQSQIMTVTAPSNGDVLTINAQQSTSAPSSNTMNVVCNGSQSGAFQATINYNTQSNLSNAASYNIIVTLASQGSQVLNTTVTPPNPTQTQALTTTYIFTSGATYYAQYAYAPSGSSNYSPLSPAIQFSCR